jgi:DNA-binding response OmpR family regulator
MNERFARAAAVAHVELGREPEFALGGIRIRPAHCELVGAGWSETLEPRVMQVLVALTRAGGEVVSRDDLIEACWEGRIVGEDKADSLAFFRTAKSLNYARGKARPVHGQHSRSI